MPKISLAIKYKNRFLFHYSENSEKLSFPTFYSTNNFVNSIYDKLKELGIKTKSKPRYVFKHSDIKLFIINVSNVTTNILNHQNYIWREKDVSEKSYTMIVNSFFRIKNKVEVIDEELSPIVKSVIDFLEL
jgi:hypothetical protein